MGLKAWDEHQKADVTLLHSLQSEAQAHAGRVEGRADTVETAIRLVADSHASRSAIAAATPGVDAVVTLADASQAPEGSRLSAAAATAETLISAGQRAGLSDLGDVVLVTGTGRNAVIALAPAGTWLPASGNGNQVSLVSGTLQVVAGDPAPQPASVFATAPSARFVSGGGIQRTALACTAISGGGLAVCSATRADLFTLNDLVSLLIFSLLLAAPVLAITGLMARLSKQQADGIVEAARDEQADRIMATVMRSARAGYWEWTPDLTSIFLSEASSELLGLSGMRTITLSRLAEQVHPDHRARVREAVEKSRAIGWLQVSFVTAHPPLRWIEMRGSTSETESGQMFGGIMLDVTERKQAEDRVKAAERRLRNAIEGFTGPFALWDHRRRLLYWNKAFANDFGLTDTLRPGMSHETVTIARAGAVRAERQSPEDPQTKLLCLPSGRWLKLVERASADGGLITVGIDVTENIGNEEELRRQKESMRKTVLALERSEGRAGELTRKLTEEKSRAENAANSKSAFLANMSHELRTPLNAINGFSEILAHELYGSLGDPRYKGYAQDILASGQHLLDMINDILDMAKIEAGKMTINPQPIDPVDPVDAAVRMIRRKASDKDIEIVLDVQPGLPEIDADHRAIRQMVLNLVSNAIKFTNGGGKITVAVQQHGPDIRVSVTDTGIGIPASDLPRLSQPFEQATGSRDRNYEGTGLGLALTKSFAEMHGGTMTISSIEGEGTTVAFTLPINGPERAEDDADDRHAA
ncbi:MAG TPA: PAS domain-containing sensor histidine kinase [Hyphomonas sp.]|nr:PAS domain-containing sensor histidine kinase [Hyphomonas sp.]HRX72758.1 PAS domain-containing sensor histidine kinase [Hyphomonas sp.]